MDKWTDGQRNRWKLANLGPHANAGATKINFRMLSAIFYRHGENKDEQITYTAPDEKGYPHNIFLISPRKQS